MTEQIASKLVQSIAHDLRTPLSRASLYLDLARGHLSDDSHVLQHIDDAVSQLGHIGRIVDILLAIERLRLQDPRHVFTLVAAETIVGDIAELYEPLISANGQQLVVINTDDVQIFCDPNLLRQALVNLVENAVRHCPANGRIGIVTSRAQDGAAVIVVSDSGTGVPANKQQAVLLPFFRLDDSRTDCGYGLGLAFVNAVAERHSAQLHLENTPAGFQITLAFPPPP